MLTAIRIVLTAVLIVEAIGDGEGEHTIEKRHVSVLARLGQLPFQGKRMGKSSLDELAERLDEEQQTKRYLGSLARTGELRVARDHEDKREDLEGLVHDLASAEELRRSRLDSLRDDLVFDEEGLPEDKRSSMAALARAGALPKRLIDEDEILSEEMNDDKRGIPSLARNGFLQKRMDDDDLEQLMSEVYGIGEKRNVASLARGFQLPQNGKRNIASIVRDRTKKDSFEEDMDDEKRNLPSIVRDRTEPLGEGKRHIGAFVANHGIPFVNADKRNLGALARNSYYPFSINKRDTSGEMDKRYVASLLRQGGLPTGDGAAQEPDVAEMKGSSPDDAKTDAAQVNKERDDDHSRSKREAIGPNMEKRYFAVRGGGKIPGGRLPRVVTRGRNRNENNGRRRH